MAKFKNKYRGQTTRASWWNYGWNGAYFITICTKNREHFFGEIINKEMALSHTGVIADILWYDIPRNSPFIKLGEFVVMPNHIHGIIILDYPVGAVGALRATPPQLDPPQSVRALHATPQPSESDKNQRMADISPKPNSISTIIRSYKSAVTKHANRLGFENGWQARFHDHIIRDEAEYQRIANYILNNPSNWNEDKFYSA